MGSDFQNALIFLNGKLTFFIIFPSIVLLGLYFTLRLRLIQITRLRLSFSLLLKKEDGCQGNISHYQAIASVLAGNFGTGNISGMAVALSSGGPGALVWMWIMAFFGAAIQYASCLLGVKYRRQNGEGEFVGGPMYYLKEGLGLKKTGALFAFFTLIGAISVGNFAQVNSVTLPLERAGLNPVVCSLVIAVIVAIVLVGGIKRLAALASLIVPLKAFLYLATALFIIGLHAEKVLPAFQLMFESAFDFRSAAGGTLGFSVAKAISSGFDRGLFATDAGTGVVPILQSSARTSDPVTDGVVTLVAPFLVMIVCTATGLVLIVTGAWQHPGLQSTNMVTEAFEIGLGHALGGYVVVIALVLFAFTTILAWAYCAEMAIGFLFGETAMRVFKYGYVMLIPVGALLHVNLIWKLADLSISLMVLTNLIGIAGLSKQVIAESNRFFYKQPLKKHDSTDL